MKYKINCRISNKDFIQVCDNWLLHQLSQLRYLHSDKLSRLGHRMHMTNIPQHITLVMAQLEEKVGRNNVRTRSLSEFRRNYLDSINDIYRQYYNLIAHKIMPKTVSIGISTDSDKYRWIGIGRRKKDFFYNVELYEERVKTFTQIQAAAMAFIETKSLLSKCNREVKLGNRDWRLPAMLDAVRNDDFEYFNTIYNRYDWRRLAEAIENKTIASKKILARG